MHCKAPVVTLCGSTKYPQLFEHHRRRLTLEGKVVLDTGGVYGHVDADIDMSSAVKRNLDQLHIQKIILCDEVFIINPNGYIGQSTCNELLLALYLGKHVSFLEKPADWENTLQEFQLYCMWEPDANRVFETFEPEDYDPLDRCVKTPEPETYHG